VGFVEFLWGLKRGKMRGEVILDPEIWGSNFEGVELKDGD